MYYPSGLGYSEVGVIGKEEDVLDLCVRKETKEGTKDRYNADVNGNGYAENTNSGYKNGFTCESPPLLSQQSRYSQPILMNTGADSSPTSPILQERSFSEDRGHISASSTSPMNSQYPQDSPPAPCFLPLPPTMSTITAKNGKPTRPFKAYPKDFLSLATTEGLLDDSNKRYMEFRRQFLTQLHATTGLGSNKNMKRPVQSVSPNQVQSTTGDVKDQAYWERRKKNNEAAKKSRDARRAKEDEIAIRAAFLERENVRLRLELASLRSETDRLRCMLYSA